MLSTSHTLAGALIGLASPSTGSALTYGVVSHLAMDMLPHWGTDDEADYTRVAVRDGLVAAAAAALVMAAAPPERRTRVVAGFVGANLPDLDKPVRFFTGWEAFPRPVRRALGRIQQGRESDHRMPQEVVRGAALFAAATGAALAARWR